jgi:large subunit ribosomal protein L17
MRHQVKTIKLGRSQAHRDALLANQTVSLIEHSRIKTTLAKAKAVRPFAEKMVTLGKKNTLHSRRTALGYLCHNTDAVKRLFAEIAPRCADRKGGYTRIVKLGQRNSDAAPMAFLEWVDSPEPVVEVAKPEAKGAKAKKGASAPATEKPVKKAKAEPAEAKDEPAATAEDEESKPARKARAKKSDAAE